MLRKSIALLEGFGSGPAVKAAVQRARDPEAADLIRRATEAQRERDWAAAEALWKAVTERCPQEVNPWLQLGNMRNELGSRASAISAFETAGALDPQAAEPLMGAAGVHERAQAWGDALAGWTASIALLQDPARSRRAKDEEQLAHAFLHAALSASMAGRPGLASDLMLDGAERVPSFTELPGNLLQRARVIRQSDPECARGLLRRCLEKAPDEDAARFELGSAALDGDDAAAWAEAAEAVEAALSRRGDDISFLRLLADLRERLHDWPAVRVLSERMAALAPRDKRHLRRALQAALAGMDLVAARRVTRAFGQAFPSEHIGLHDLAQGYEATEELGRARLLYRFLRKQWPHSRWHTARYIVLTAATRSLPEADRILRAEIAERGRDVEIDRAYCDAAHGSGDLAEARRRLEWFVAEHPDDESAQVFLGYVIANTAGLDDAERHFHALATRSFQAKGALIGLAHMAMRRREPHAAHERWAAVVELYPEDTIGRVELARSAYEIRDTALALRICEAQLRALPGDATMGEFYAWLLAAIGRFEAAWTYLRTLRGQAGPVWLVLELSLLSAGQTGRLDAEFETILDSVPQGSTRLDGRRFYHAIRQLWSARRQDLLLPLVRRAAVEPARLAWLSPYLRARPGSGSGPDPEFHAAVDGAWTQARGRVRGDIAGRVAAASDAEIARLLDRPRQELPTVHIVNKFEQRRGGSELHALDMAEKLREHAKVELWAPETPHPHFSAALGVKTIAPGQGQVPHGGVLVLIGVYFGVAAWVGKARPDRVIFLYNTFEAPLLFERIQEVHERTGVRPELLFCSDMMKEECGLPGFFEPSPVDITLFRPRAAPFSPGHRFTVGRHSRDVIEKHHPEDWKVYEAVAQAGGGSRLLGGTCMAPVFPRAEAVEFLPARPDGIVEFLQGLDCYYYNTSTWIEPWGRVVVEAMSCGLPVLANRCGGYAQVIEHARNGLLFDTVDEAAALMRELAADPALRQRLGAEARRSAETLLGEPALRRLVSFYLAQS